MAKCFNPNSSEYKALKKVFKTNLAVDSIINTWQQANNSEEFPTVKQAKKFVADSNTRESLLKGEFSRQLMYNLIQKGFVKLNSKNDFEVNPNRTSFNIQSIYRYMDFNNIPLDAISFKSVGDSIVASLDYNQLSLSDISKEARGVGSNHTIDVVMHLKKMFPGVNISMVNETEAKAIYDALPDWKKGDVPFSDVKSFYVDGQVILIRGRVTNEVAIEEMLHPFIDAVYADNKELFDSLLAEAKTNFPELVESIESEYNETRGFSEKDRDLELVTQTLTKYFKREFENTPTQTFREKVRDLLQWFSNIIKDLYKYITGGRALSVSDISNTTTFSSLAKLLNTQDLKFEFKSAESAKIKYSLSPSRQRMLDTIYQTEGFTEEQKETIEKLLHIPLTRNEEMEGLSAGPVILNEKDHTYRNVLDPSLNYTSSTTAVNGKSEVQTSLSLDVGNDFDRIGEGLCLFETFDEISKDLKILNNEEAKKAYDQLARELDVHRLNGEILLPQVIVSHEGDDGTNIGGAIDILVITKTGKLKIIDLKTSKNKYSLDEAAEQYEKEWDIKADSMLAPLGVKSLSTKQKHNIQVNMYKRMLENKGFEFDHSNDDAATTFNIWVDIKGQGKDQKWGGNFRLLKTVKHPMNAVSTPYVEAIVPKKSRPLTPEQRKQLKADGKTESIDDKDAKEVQQDLAELQNQGATDFGDIEMEVLYKALTDYRVSLIERRDLLNKLQKTVYMDETRDKAFERINHNIVLTTQALEVGAKDTKQIFSQLLRDAKNELESYEKYLLNEENAGHPDYIMRARNFQEFKQVFTGLHMFKDFGGLNINQKNLILSIQATLNRLGETTAGKLSVVDQAIFNHVYDILKNNTTRDVEVYTDPDTGEVIDPLKQLMLETIDTSTVTMLTKDTNTSEDMLLAIMKKIWHQEKQKVLTKIEEKEDIVRLGAQLSKMSPGQSYKDIFSFMVELDENGDHSGLLVMKFGAEYQKLKKDAIALTQNELGEPEQYRTGTSEEDLRFNEDLYKRKQEQRAFFAAETVDDNGMYQDGNYHRYTAEWKAIRSQNMTWVTNGERGRWVHKNPKSAEAESFYAKYYTTKLVTSPEIIDGKATGVLKEYTVSFVKKEYVEPREETQDGQSLTSDKYRAIMNIDESDQLAVTKRAFYKTYMKYYESWLDELPPNVRDSMLGSAPRVAANLSSALKTKSGSFTDLWARTTKSVKYFFKPSTRLTRVNVNSAGELINSIPIMYTGALRSEEALERLDAKIAKLKEDYANNPKADSKKYDQELKSLEAQLQGLYSRPEAKDLSFNMVESLLMFGGMAENYKIMNAIEDTMIGFEKVIGKRKYQKGDTAVQKVARTVTGKTTAAVYLAENETSNIEKSARNFMKMVFYDDEAVTQTMTNKAISSVLNYTSLAYVGFNVFGNFNNYVIGRINNNIETFGQRYHSRDAGLRASAEFNKRAVPDLIHRTAYNTNKARAKGVYDPYKPMSKYEALVDFFRMMDSKGDLREVLRADGSLGESYYARAKKFGYSVAYAMQDAAEYNVQTKVGIAILMDTHVLNKKTGEILTLYDAFDFENQDLKLKDGFDTIIKVRKNIPTFRQALKGSNIQRDESGNMIYDEIGTYDETFRYNLRMKIREVNKQIHGNYAREDRMYLQTYALGKIAAQFHKWVAPAIRARYQHEYFDENLGWMEGRWRSMLHFLRYLISNGRSVMTGDKSVMESWMRSIGYKADGSQEDDRALNKALNIHRTTAEFTILGLTMLVTQLLNGIWDGDDDNETVKRLKNIAKYQSSRVEDEMMLFVPAVGMQEVLAFFESPFASTRTLGEFGGLLDAAYDYGYSGIKYGATGNEEDWFYNKDVYYQRGRRSGELKLSKELADVAPILYEIKKWQDFIQTDNFYIK